MRVLVHRCPHCKSNKVIQPKPKGKSDTQVGLELVGSLIEGAYLGTDGSITRMISDSYYDPSKQHKYLCRECRYTWNADLSIDETPIEELESEKKLLKSTIKSEMIRKAVWSVIIGAITIWSFLYCWNNDFVYRKTENVWLLGEKEVEHYHFGWLGVGLIFIIALFITIHAISSCSEKYKTIKILNAMGAEEFRNSNLRP